MSHTCMLCFAILQAVLNAAAVAGVLCLINRNRSGHALTNLVILGMTCLCMTISNVQWCLQILSDATPAYWFYFLGKVCAPLDYALFSAFIWRRYLTDQKCSATLLFSLLLPFLCCLVAIINCTVIPFQAQEKIDLFSRAINFIIWPLAAFLMSLLLRLSQQTLKVVDTVFLLSMMLILTSALASEHNLLTVGYDSASWEQIGWTVGFAGLAWSVMSDVWGSDPVLHKPAYTSEWFSLRSFVGISVFFSNMALLTALSWVGLLSIKNGSDLTCALLLGYASWCVSIFFAIVLSRKIREIRARMSEPESDDASSCGPSLRPVAEQTLLAEVDSIIAGYNERVAHINVLNVSLNEKAKQAALGQAAKQVAHDIRSPLAALKMALSYLDDVEEDIRILMRDAIHRVEDIANDLLEHHRNHKIVSDEPKQVLVSAVVEQLVSQLRLQHRARLRLTIACEFDDDTHFLCARAPSGDFKRVVSNLVNNAADAIDGAGLITVGLRRRDDHLQIEIADNGKGMSQNVLDRLGEEGLTSGKRDGNGLGVFQARRELASWGGTLAYASEIGKGTTAKIILPTAPSPQWLQTRIELKTTQSIVVLDDDVSIHRVWRERLGEIHPFTSCSTVLDLQSVIKARPREQDPLYLVDQELTGSALSGLETIEELQLKEALLVTSNYDDHRVISACERAQIKIIPKFLAARIPIVTASRSTSKATDGQPYGNAWRDSDTAPR